MDAIFIQARLKSTRLKRKVILNHKGRTIIEYLIKRLKDNINIPLILLTSNHQEDNPLEEIAKNNEIICFRGSEDDVINRFYTCALENEINRFYLVFGDEPFTDLDAVHLAFEKLKNTSNTIINNTGLPEGTYGYGMTLEVAKKLEDGKTSCENEVWGEMAKRIGINILTPFDSQNNDDIRLTIDYEEDFDVFKSIVDYFGENIFSKTVFEIKEHYKSVNLGEINKNRNSDYKERIKNQGEI
jgi:spore coat polysaccharide biosynthesis protein SpsF